MSVAKQTQPSPVVPQSQENDDVGYVEESEKSTKASASAGVNLNVFGAIAGAFSSKSKTTTDDGGETRSSTEESREVKKIEGSRREERHEQAKIKGAGAGQMNADAAGEAEQSARQKREVEA